MFMKSSPKCERDYAARGRISKSRFLEICLGHPAGTKVLGLSAMTDGHAAAS
jgi:hypothetical protein